MTILGGKEIKKGTDENWKNDLLTLTYNKAPLFLLIENWKLKGEILEYVTQIKPEKMFGGGPWRTNPYKMWLLKWRIITIKKSQEKVVKKLKILRTYKGKMLKKPDWISKISLSKSSIKWNLTRGGSRTDSSKGIQTHFLGTEGKPQSIWSWIWWRMWRRWSTL